MDPHETTFHGTYTFNFCEYHIWIIDVTHCFHERAHYIVVTHVRVPTPNLDLKCQLNVFGVHQLFLRKSIKFFLR